MAMHVKKDDMVQIISGDHRGSVGKVISIIPKKNAIIVQGFNMVKKHVKPSRKNPQGGRVNIERPIHISNVLPVDPKTSKGTKAKYVVKDDGSKRKVSVDGNELCVVRKAKK
jgi:large subunit ribosomal protein L24